MKVTLENWDYMGVLSPPFRFVVTLTRVRFTWPDDSSPGTSVTEDHANQVPERKGDKGIGECYKIFGI